MLTTEEIRALCDAAGLGIETSLEPLFDTYAWGAVLYEAVGFEVFAQGSGATKDEAIQKAWENYVNNRRD